MGCRELLSLEQLTGTQKPVNGIGYVVCVILTVTAARTREVAARGQTVTSPWVGWRQSIGWEVVWVAKLWRGVDQVVQSSRIPSQVTCKRKDGPHKTSNLCVPLLVGEINALERHGAVAGVLLSMIVHARSHSVKRDAPAVLVGVEQQCNPIVCPKDWPHAQKLDG
ncbi:hypothetical protein BC831DRAFT_458189 [Entophlyctis helioformis]|nr:hypothetical protein BC831DRAFT_458189 [Entophlyctis helioformis]